MVGGCGRHESLPANYHSIGSHGLEATGIVVETGGPKSASIVESGTLEATAVVKFSLVLGFHRIGALGLEMSLLLAVGAGHSRDYTYMLESIKGGMSMGLLLSRGLGQSLEGVAVLVTVAALD